jgi:hypothetical protein
MAMLSTTISSRRSTRSAAAPAGSARNTAGSVEAVCTSASSAADSDCAAITSTAPTVSLQFISCTPRKASHMTRNEG